MSIREQIITELQWQKGRIKNIKPGKLAWSILAITMVAAFFLGPILGLLLGEADLLFTGI
ncbi:MAG: hypothetical protein ACOCXP_00685 [Candidatus Dojkabacteria bacterium]